MFLAAVDLEKARVGRTQMRPILVTKESPRKAYFKRINRDRRAVGSVKRHRDTGRSIRGNSWAGNANGQRVVVKINPVKNKARKTSSALNSSGKVMGGSGANLSAHIKYISRDKAGKDQEKAALFAKKIGGIDGADFFERSRNDRHHFRMIISPERGDEIKNFEGYVRDVMGRVEMDLGTKLDWISAVHYDTDNVHAHVIIRGKKARGEDLVIGRDYIASGIRMRAQERATELLGERSREEILKSIEREVDAMRVTSFDRFIEKNLDGEQEIDVSAERNFGQSEVFEKGVKDRLSFLESIDLAKKQARGVYTVEKEFKDTLYEIQNRGDVLRRLHGRMKESDLEGLSLYSIKAGEGEVIEGFVKDKGFTDEITDKKYLIVEDLGEGLHYVPVGENMRADDVDQGSLIRVRPGDKSTGKADANILMIAQENEGIYDVEKHRVYVEKEMSFIEPEDRQGYLDSHLKRLETLEKKEIVEQLKDGRYKVPDDLIEKGVELTREINESENKRFYPLIDILSKEPLKELAGAEKKTWLDKELYKGSRGKGGLSGTNAQIEDALEQRKEWLIERNLGFVQSNGHFAFRDAAFGKLDVMEVLNAGQSLADQAEVTFNKQKVREEQAYQYIGFVKLETGYWAVVGNTNNQLQMVQLYKKPEFEQGKSVAFTAMEGAMFEMRALERSKEQGKSREVDSDEGMEL